MDIINDVSFTGLPSRPINPEVWKTFVRAIRNHQTLDVTYRAEAKPDAKSYRLYPYHLANIRGDWYVFGIIPPHEDMTQFTLSRFERAALSDKHFMPPPQGEVKQRIKEAFGQFVHSDNEPVHKVRIAFDAEVAHRITAREWHPGQKLKTKKDGSGMLEFPAASLEEAMRWVLGWGKHVKVLGPKGFKDLAADEIRSMNN